MQDGKVLNPRTKRYIKVGSALYRKLVKEGVIKQRIRDIREINRQLNEAQQTKKCPDGKVLNPQTNRCVSINGNVYKRMQARIEEHEKAADRLLGVRKCREDQVMNPKTQRCIKKGLKLYKELKAAGVQFEEELPPVPHAAFKSKSRDAQSKTKSKSNPRSKPKSKSQAEAAVADAQQESKAKRQCSNAHTFMMFEDVQDIADDNFLVLPSGYCFSVTELLAYIKSDTFDNANPHDGEPLFPENILKESSLKKHPELVTAIQEYINRKNRQLNDLADILHTNMDVVYQIGKAGRICYFDHLSEIDGPNPFEYSLEALAELSESLEKLSKDVQDVFFNLRASATSVTLQKCLEDAQNNGRCIHGVGTYMIKLFTRCWMIMENKYTDIVYDPLKTKLIFYTRKSPTGTHLVGYQNMECRFYLDVFSNYYTNRRNIWPDYYKSSSLFMKRQNTYTDTGLSKVFDKCLNDSAYSTKDYVDNWHEVDDWRKMMFIEKNGSGSEQRYCFDLLFLMKTITNQLNQQKNSNPFPQYPKNPFTRKPFSIDDLVQIKRRISINYITIPVVLRMFLYNPDLWTEDSAYAESREWQDLFITACERDFRFVRKFSAYDNDALEVVGIWEMKEFPVQLDESLILQLFSDPGNPQLISLLKKTKAYVIPDTYYFSDRHVIDMGNIKF